MLKTLESNLKRANKIKIGGRTPNKLGFTLLEIMVALTILTVGILAVTQMAMIGMRTNAEINQRMYARIMLNRHFEFLRELPNTDSLVDDPDWDHVQPTSLLPDDRDELGNPDFSMTITDTTANYSYVIYWNVVAGMPDNNTNWIRTHVQWGRLDGGYYTRRISGDLIKLIE